MKKTILIIFSVMTISLNAFAYVPDVGPGHCVADCDAPDYSSSSSSSYSSYSYDSYAALGDSFYQLGQSIGQSIADSWAQAAANQQTGLSYNSYGNSALANGNWDDAISQYEQALAYLPNNYVIQQNLKKAKSGRSNQQAVDAHARGDYESALYYYRESLEMDPADHVVRNNYRLTKKMQRQKNAHERADRLDTLMAETSHELQREFGNVTSEVENVSVPLELNFDALNAISNNPNAGNGLRIKSDIPMPTQPESAEEHAFRLENQLSLEAEAGRLPEGAELDQLELIAEQSEKAAGAETLEQAKIDSSIGFDTPFPPRDLPVFDEESEEWSPARSDLESRLQTLKEQPEVDTVAIANTKQALSDLANQENFEKFRAEEALRTGVVDSPGPLAREAPEQRRTEAVEVSEMSVGQDVLSQVDQIKSESALAAVRQEAIKSLKQGLEDEQFDQLQKQKIELWKNSDPKVHAAVKKNKELLKRAEAEYKRRQKESTLENPLMQALGAAGAYQWPGPVNSEQPLPNPVADEDERWSAILKIHQELKQSDRLMEMYDREATAK